jgi:hypothetical protein
VTQHTRCFSYDGNLSLEWGNTTHIFIGESLWLCYAPELVRFIFIPHWHK